MNGLFNKIILFVLCMAAYLPVNYGGYAVVWVIIAVSIASLCEYVNHPFIRVVFFIGYVSLCIFYREALYFLPLICYEIVYMKPRWLVLLALVPLGAQVSASGVPAVVLITGYCALAYLMKRQTLQLERQKSEYIALRDSAKELSLSLQEKNKELLEKQDYEVNLATLHERNRIAREMHDTVGHLLSSAILQLGALLATCKDDTQRESLEQLKSTLSRGMDGVRKSIHNLHDESIDLFAEVQALAEGFRFCPVSFEYDVQESPERAIKYAFILIIKEALANVARHSNATQVQMIIREHPALYQLIVRDNGTKEPQPHDEGLGLKNIKDRVDGLSGILHITHQKGFELFVSVPKAKT